MITTYQTSAHTLSMIPPGSIHAIMTSPPYFGLRKYEGEQGVEWPSVEYAPMPGLPSLTIPAMQCPLGLEPTLEAYIGHLILCLREWRRVLRDDGTCWVNLGDSYASDSKWGGATGGKHVKGLHGSTGIGRQKRKTGIGDKQLLGVPWRFAFAAQADGWVLRSDIIWAKGVSFCPNYSGSSMPESVRDRPSKSHEYLFLLAKQSRYYFDMDAVREPHVKERDWPTWEERKADGAPMRRGDPGQSGDTCKWAGVGANPQGRNLRSVWTLSPQPFPGSHFAVWPPALVEPMVRASTSERGVCPGCGSQWRRVVERATGEAPDSYNGSSFNKGKTKLAREHLAAVGEAERTTARATTGWEPSCTCNAGDPIPATVLDPFAGSGTTGRVAVKLGRRAVLCDVSGEYLDGLVPGRTTVQMEMAV